MDLVIRGRMDLVIRGRSQDWRGARTRGGPARQDRTRGRGMTGEARGRTGPEGVGGPAWREAGRDQRAWEDLSGARQERTRGHGGESRGSRKRLAAAAAVGEGTPEGARGAGQSSSSTEWPSLKQLQQFQSQPASQPVMRGWERAHF